MSREHRIRMERFHVTSRRPCWCPWTKERQPYWCPQLIVRELNSILMQTFSFVLVKNVLIDHVSENALYVGSPSFRKIRGGLFFFNLPYTISWQVPSWIKSLEKSHNKVFERQRNSSPRHLPPWVKPTYYWGSMSPVQGEEGIPPHPFRAAQIPAIVCCA